MEASTSADQESTSISSTSTIEDAVLIKECLDFSSPWHFSDVILVVGDTKLHVHKCILSMWSPVFRTMFSSKFKESKAKKIPLPGKCADEVEVLLKFIYSSGTKPTVTDENYQFLLQLADEYQMDRVKSMCSEFLVNKIQVSNCLEFFKLAEQFHLDDVTEECYAEVCYSSSADLEGSEHFNGFEPEFKVDICMRVIKELERSLAEYVTICSDIIKRVYTKVYENINGCSVRESRNPEEHIERHMYIYHSQNKKLKYPRTNAVMNKRRGNGFVEFEFSCPHCIEEIKQTDRHCWNDSIINIFINLKEPLNKLYALLPGAYIDETDSP